MMSESLDPLFYLSGNNYTTSYDELLERFDRLKMETACKPYILKSLIHDNFEKFIVCKNAIDSREINC